MCYKCSKWPQSTLEDDECACAMCRCTDLRKKENLRIWNFCLQMEMELWKTDFLHKSK